MSSKSESAQAKQTNDAFRESHERLFGNAKPQRGRTVYTHGGQPLAEPIEVAPEWENPEPKSVLRVDVSYMDGVRATDGTDISSKAKRREYMHRKGLADTSDFDAPGGHWEKKAKEREHILSGEADTRWRKQTIGELLYQAKRKPRK